MSSRIYKQRTRAGVTSEVNERKMASKLIALVISVMIVTRNCSARTVSVRVSADVDRGLTMLNAMNTINSLGYVSFGDLVLTQLQDLVESIVASKTAANGSNSSSGTAMNSDQPNPSLIVVLDNTLSAILEINPTAYPDIPSVRKECVSVLKKLAEYTGRALALARKGNSSNISKELSSLEKLTIPLTTQYNAPVYGALRLGKETPKALQTAIASAIERGSFLLSLGVIGIYNGIRMAMRANSSNKEEIMLEIAAQVNLNVTYNFVAEANHQFDFFRRIYIGFSIIESADTTNAVDIFVIGDDESGDISDCENSTNDSSESNAGGQNQTANNSTDISESKKAASGSLQFAVAIIFAAIRALAEDVVSGNLTENDGCSIIETVTRQEYGVSFTFIDIILNVTLAVDPEAASIIAKVQPIIRRKVMETVTGIDAAIALISTGTNSAQVKAQFENNENKTIRAAEDVATNVYLPLMNGQNTSSPIGVGVMMNRNETTSIFSRIIQNIFNALKFILAEVFPDLYFPDLDCSSSIKSYEDDSFFGSREIVDNLFNAIEMIDDSSSEESNDNCSFQRNSFSFS